MPTTCLNESFKSEQKSRTQWFEIIFFCLLVYPVNEFVIIFMPKIFFIQNMMMKRSFAKDT